MNIERKEHPLPETGISFEQHLKTIDEAFSQKNQNFWREHYTANANVNVSKCKKLQKNNTSHALKKAFLGILVAAGLATASVLILTGYLFSSLTLLEGGNNGILSVLLNSTATALAIMTPLVAPIAAIAYLVDTLLTKRRYSALLKSGNAKDILQGREYVSTYSLQVVPATQGRTQAVISNEIKWVKNNGDSNQSSYRHESYPVLLDEDIAVSTEQVAQLAAFVANLQKKEEQSRKQAIEYAQTILDGQWHSIKTQANLDKVSQQTLQKELAIKHNGQVSISHALNTFAQEALHTHRTDNQLQHDVAAMLKDDGLDQTPLTDTSTA